MGDHGRLPPTAAGVGIYGKDIRSQGTRAPLAGGPGGEAGSPGPPGGSSPAGALSPERLGSDLLPRAPGLSPSDALLLRPSCGCVLS